MAEIPAKEELRQSIWSLVQELPEEQRVKLITWVGWLEHQVYTEREAEKTAPLRNCQSDLHGQYMNGIREGLAEARSDLFPFVSMGLEEEDLPTFAAALDRYTAWVRVNCRNEDADYLDSLPPGGEALRGPYWYRQGVHEAADILRDRGDLETPDPNEPARKGES